MCSKCFPSKGDNWVVAFPPSELPDFISTTQLSDFLCGIWLPRLLSLVPPYSPAGKTDRTSRVATTYQCLTCQGLRLRRSPHGLAIPSVRMLLSVQSNTSASLTGISELNPFNQMAFGPPANCLRLKMPVTRHPPRLATSEWLTLARRGSHPLYVAT